MGLEVARLMSWLPSAGYKVFKAVARLPVTKLISTVNFIAPSSVKYLANILTGLRLAVSLCLWLMIVACDWPRYLYVIFVLNALAYATDLGDGEVARQSHSETRLGAWLDQAADKLLLLPNAWLAYCLLPNSLFFSGQLSWLAPRLLGIIVVVEASLVCLRLYAAWRHKHIEANSFGKAKVFCQCCGFLSASLIYVNTTIFSSVSMIFLLIALVFAFGSIYGHIKTHWQSFISPRI